MDNKNTLWGLLLMGLIIFGFMYVNQDKGRNQKTGQEIEQAEQQDARQAQSRAQNLQNLPFEEQPDSLLQQRFGAMAGAFKGTPGTTRIHNDVITLEINNKGGMIADAVLKDYKSYTKEPLHLISPQTDTLSLTLSLPNQRLQTKDLYFTPTALTDTSVIMRSDLGNGAYLDICYNLMKGSYLVSMNIEQKGMAQYTGQSASEYTLNWNQKMRRHEAGRVFEERNSALYYMFIDGDVNNLSENKNKEKSEEKLRWVGYKNQFFSNVLISKTDIDRAELSSQVLEKDPDYIKTMQSSMILPYNPNAKTVGEFVLYMGPNSYPLLSDIQDNIIKGEDMHLTKVIPLGWTLFRWINTLIIIPVFSLLSTFISNYGIIILLLTIFIKLLLFPFTYKSYMSQAKMRVLAPEVKAINEKYPGQENAMKRQTETMALYSRAGASPFSGCLPMLLQMPVLIAMFSFFPSAIELRGQSFLWAKDLSAPDVIFTLPFSIPFYGDKVSLFCLLMTAVNIIYTKINMQTQPSAAGGAGMKWMMYLMPVMFLCFFNDYASGLSYYYFLSLLITILQTYIFRKVVKEDKVRAAMKANAGKKGKKKSGFMVRLEEAQKRQEAMLRQQQKQRRR